MNKHNYIRKSALMIGLVLLQFFASAQVKTLSIGDTCPEEMIKYINKISGQNDNLVQKSILIDFWGTYCIPCIKKLPLADSLEKENREKLIVLAVTAQKDSLLVNSRLNETVAKSSLVNIIGDTLLRQYFPYYTIPHYVWIDNKGKVSFISSEISREAVSNFLNQQPVKLKPKIRVKTDGSQPLYAKQQIILNDELLSHSMIAKYRIDIPTGDARGDNHINVSNNSILHLYQIAFGKFDTDFFDMNRVIITGLKNEVDSANFGIWTGNKFQIWNKNIEKNAFSYELFIPGSLKIEKLFSFMQEDLNRYFGLNGITGKLEKRNQKVLALVSLREDNAQQYKETQNKSSVININSDVPSVPMMFFMAKLRTNLGNEELPLINDTGYNGSVNVKVDHKVKGIESINKVLRGKGLKIEEKIVPIDMLTITVQN